MHQIEDILFLSDIQVLVDLIADPNKSKLGNNKG